MANRLHEKYGGKTAEALRRAARAEVPGVDLLLGVIERMSVEVARPRRSITPERLADLRWVYDQLLKARDGLLERIKLRYDLDAGDESAAQKPVASAKPATPALPPPRVPAVAVKPATRTLDDPGERLQPEVVARLGKEPDAVIAADYPGMTARRIELARDRMHIPACRRKVAWTKSRLATLVEEPDNVKAAAKLGISVAAVKTARSRRKLK